MAEVGSAFVTLMPSARGFGSKLNSAIGGPVKSSGSTMGKVFGAAMLGVVGGIVAGGAIVGKFTKDAAVLDTKMREVVTLFGETGAAADKSLGQVQTQVKALSNEFGFAQEELTGGLYSAISAGVPKENAFTFMQVASKAAIGGVTDVETAVDGITTTINAFGLEAKDAQAISDSMFTAVKGGKTTFGELSDSLFNVAPAAAAAKVSFKEVNAALATLTAGGTPTSVATTQLRAALTGLQKPSKDLDKIFGDLGFKNAQVAVESKGLGFALDAVKKASKGNNGELQKLLGSSEAVAAANVLAGTGAKKFRTELDAQAKSAGATNNAFKVVNQGAERQFAIFKTNIRNVGLSVGQALLPAVTAVLKFVNNDLGPAFERVKVAVAPAVAAIKSVFASLTAGGGGASTVLASLKSVGTSLAATLVPALRAAATTFQTVLLPAILRVGAYIASALMPIFRQVATVVATQVIPIIGMLATWFYTKLVPAVMAIVSSVATSLKPVFDALVGALRNSVLPTVSLLLAKFREWWPTISKVIVIVVKVIGAVLKLAAAILGKVLPPLIRFAGFLLRNIVAAAAAAVGAVVRIVGVLISVGTAIGTAIGWFDRFAKAVDSKIRDALRSISGLPGKALSALGSVGSTLYGAGQKLIQGLIDGIASKIEAAVQKVRDGLAKIRAMLPGSPIKEGPLVSWNNGGAGKRLIDQGLIAGIDERGPALAASMRGALSHISTNGAAPRLSTGITAGGAAPGTNGAGITQNIYETSNPRATAAESARRLAFAGAH